MVTSMDFVDLDKVLDQFEEEEKAAEEILPGRELKPSGYAEFLVNQQDRPWESLSLGQPLESNGKQVHHHSEPVVYDDPYDSIDRSAVDSRQLGFPSKHSLVEQPVLQGRPTLGTTLSLDQDLAQAKLKEETIEAYLPPLSLSNGVGQVTGSDVNGWGEGVKGEDGERRGLIASQPASIQTDTLSPASERELLSYPLPKSDILVEGHGPTLSPSQPVQGHVTGPCPSEGMEPNTHYASSSNSAGTVPDSAEQLSQETQEIDQCHVGAEVNGSSASDQPALGMEKSEETPDADAGDWRAADSDGSDREPSDTSIMPAEKPTGTSLQQEMMAASAREGGDDQLAVGFDAGEGDMDRDEVDAYLEELESSMGGEDGDASGQSAVCGPSAGDSTELDGRGDSVGQDMSTTAADVHSADDGDVVTSAHTGDRSAEDMAEDRCGDVTQTVGVVGSEDTAGQTVNDVAQHSAHAEDAAVTSDLSAASFLRDDDTDSHPDVVADVGGGPNAPGRTDLLPEGSTETQEQGAVLRTEGSASNTSFGLSNTGRTEENAGMVLNRLVDTTSLQFPVAGNKNGVSSVVKGKLEIEGLLDEIVAARLAQKSSEAMSVSPGQSSVDQTMPREGDSSDKNRTQGWGPDGSMVCSAVREPSKTSPEMISPPDSGSPSPNLGIGARPKDPSHLKKNRPNSLLGLSKISLASPFSPPQQTAAGAVVEVMLPANQQPSTGAELGDTSRDCRTQNHSVGSRQLGMSPPPAGAPPPEGGAFIPLDGTPAPSVADDMADEAEESPVLRHPDMRGDGRVMGEGEEASNGVHRPQSWSPSTLSSPPTQRSKRPTSLNLPVRQDRMGSLSPDGDNGRARKAGMVAESGGSSEAGSSEEESMGVGGTDGCVYEEMSSHDPQQEQEGAGAAAELPMETHPPSILHLNLGKIAPTWLPDADALACMECAARFTFTKRRHHCRACGKIFCSTCCGQKSRLTYLENKEGRVCVSCHHLLSSAQCVRPAGVSCRSPNPNNPIEYCSTVPPTQQANARAPLPTVMVPTGVLKRHGSNRKSEPKQVMFSDGIRPGGDLTELDGSDQARIPPRRSARAQKKVEKQQGEHSSAKTRRLRGSDGLRNPCLIPDEGLPPVVVHTDEKGEVSLSENADPASLLAQIKNEEASPVVFAINLNLFVLVKIMNLDCCLKRVVWCFTTQGMVTVGQEELVIVLETLPEEETVPRDIFCHFSTVYEEAGKGNTVSHMGHSIFNQPFLDSSTHGGFLYLRSTFQCTNKLILPPAPFLFPILLHKWETPWAKVFPIRLLLRLGAEHRYYPCPLVSIRNRKPVFFEIGHTIMNLLADFRNFQYMLQQIRGVSIHMEDQKTFINFPRNRYQDVMKVVSSSNEHVMALGASFSLDADSHLVCIQNEDGNYQTQAINIQNKPRQVTGASFVVFNGALKSSSGLRAKSSIVEDGLMIQILPETMGALKQSLKDMKDFTIPCGSLSLPQPEEVVTVRWVDDDKAINVGVKSPVDGMSLEGVESVQVHNATDYVGDRYAIRWTQLFFLQTENGTSRWEPVDLSRVAETLANAVCIALTPHLQKLKEAKLTKIGLRVTLQPDSVGYEAGSSGERLPDFYIKDLDNALIPVIHGAITTNQDGPIVLELLLYVIH